MQHTIRDNFVYVFLFWLPHNNNGYMNAIPNVNKAIKGKYIPIAPSRTLGLTYYSPQTIKRQNYYFL